MKEKKEEVKEKDNRSLGEKLDDGLDDLMGGIQDAIYGEPYKEDSIPYTYETPQGIRKINKVQSRRNLNKKIFTKPVLKAIGIILGIIIAGLILMQMISCFLMS